MASTKRTILSTDGHCEVCDWTASKNAMAATREHTRRTGHLTWVTVDYGYSRKEQPA